MIYCRDLLKTYKHFVAVDRVSLSIDSGICALLGPNGAGKSTLLGLLTGLILPDAGALRVAGVDLRNNSFDVKQRIGVLPETLGLFDALTVEEHLELTGPVYGVTRQETRLRTDALLRLLSLEDARATFAGDCSYGMRKKAALAMALVHNPRVLFLDEPFDGLDPSVSLTIQHLLSTIAQRGITVLFTSHVLSTVEQLTSQILIMRAGKIVWISDDNAARLPLHEHYLDLMEEPLKEDLSWLGH